MKKFLLGLGLWMGLLGGSGKAQAFNSPYVHYGWYGGYYSAWGYFPWYYNPVFPIYGYSYWAAFNYAPYYASFGAISVSRTTGQFGVAWDSPTRFEAINAANFYCGAADCAPVVWVQGGCAAVAKSSAGQTLSWGYHSSKNRAIQNALQACQMSHEPDCKIEAWVCSY